MPEDERQLITQTELENRVAVLLGGIAAEEIVYQETSTGAQNDLQRATDIARRMVTEFGMSPRLGRVHYGESQRSPFLGAAATMPTEPAHSAETVREIDLEIKRIIDGMLKIAHDVLSERRNVLEHMTRDLVETEVMNADQLEAILDQYKTGPQIKPGTHAANSTAETTASDVQDENPPLSDTADGP